MSTKQALPLQVTSDLEEDDETLDSNEGLSLEFWASKQKELVTNVVDYNLNTLVGLVDEEIIDLDPRFQRRLRWDDTKKSRLIESFLMNVPVPPVFLNEDEYGRYSVIDGKQRLNAVHEFLTNHLVLQGLTVFSDINGNRFSDIPSRLRSIVRTRPTIRAIIILRQSDQDVKYEVFQRLNTGGSHLNAQEIRNNAFHGSFNDMIMNISEDRLYQSCLGIKNKYKSAMYQQMRDAELVLRFFTFRDNWRDFKGGMKRAMDAYAENNRNLSVDRLQNMRQDFFHSLTAVSNIFGEHAFQRWIPEKLIWRKQVVASLFDAQMFAFRDYQHDQLLPNREAIVAAFKSLCANAEFRRSIDAATNTPSYFRSRINDMREMLARAIN